MAKRDEIVGFLDGYLKIGEIDDNSLNGMQVEGKDDVVKIVLAVDACQDVFDRAQEIGADMIIVHHGLFWKATDPRIAGILKKRVEVLLRGGITLYSAHLPLDSHPDVGNNACMAKRIGLQKLLPFGEYHGVDCGYYGHLDKGYDRDEFVRMVDEKIGKIKVRHLFGVKRIRTVGIVSGGGAFAVSEMKRNGVDVLISGEAEHTLYNKTKEYGVNAVYLGHYDSEVFGVKAMGEKLKEKFGDVETVFVDYPSGL